MASPLARWLATLDEGHLAEILRRRPEALAAPAPTDLAELADRLQQRGPVTAALAGLPLPAIQLIEVIQAFGAAAADRRLVGRTVGRPADDPDLAATLHVLAQRALVWPDGDALRMAGPLWSAFAHPLGLGAPAAQLLDRVPVVELRRIAAALGLRAAVDRGTTAAAVVARLGDADHVTALLAAAPPDTRELLADAAAGAPLVPAPLSYAGGERALPPGAAWAADQGLLLPDGWDQLQLPAEVGRVLRGAAWRAPFDPHPPALPHVTAAADAVGREAAAAAAVALGQFTALLDECAGTPVTQLKSGGVGARELRRLARGSAGDDAAVRLWLELGHAAGLLGFGHAHVLATDAYDGWVTAEPGPRLAPVLRAWLTLPGAPTAGAGAGSPVLLRQPDPVAAELRAALLRLLAELPTGAGATGPEPAAATLHWRAPMCGGDDAPALIAATWREAHLLGVLAHGALTPIGRALLDGGPEAVAGAVGELLPAPVPTAMFQADLTAVVPGVPANALAALLDEAAVRESRGAAATWRFGAASVRAALDRGRTAAELLARLREVAVGGAVPQVLEFLIGDVARRHGTVRVREVRCVLRAEDPVLLAEIAGARALRPLRLAVLAPTVLGSARPAAETLAALRDAGYAPVGEDATGVATVERAARRRAPDWSPPPAAWHSIRRPRAAVSGPAADPAALSAALLAARNEPPLADVVVLHPRRPEPADGFEEPGGGAAGLPDPAGRPDASGPGPAALTLVRGALSDAPEAGPDSPAGGAPADRSTTIGRSTTVGWGTTVGGAATVADVVAACAPRLGGAERHTLATAIELGSPVRIEYTSASGVGSTRVIEPLELSGHLVIAWCHLRDEERAFALDRIRAVDAT